MKDNEIVKGALDIIRAKLERWWGKLMRGELPPDHVLKFKIDKGGVNSVCRTNKRSAREIEFTAKAVFNDE